MERPTKYVFICERCGSKSHSMMADHIYDLEQRTYVDVVHCRACGFISKRIVLSDLPNRQ